MGINYLFFFCRILYRFVFWGTVTSLGVIAIVVACLMIKLTYSPLSLSFLKPSIEQGLTQVVPDLKVQIGKLHLIRGQKNFRLILRAKDVKILGTKTNIPIFSVPRMDLLLSTKSIFTGELLPKTVTFYQSELKIKKSRSGTFEIDFNPKDANSSSTFTGWNEILEHLVHSNSLKRISIINSTIVVEDEKQDKNWCLHGVETHFSRLGSDMNLRISAKFEKTLLTCSGELKTQTGANFPEKLDLKVRAALKDLPFNQLHILWPEFLAPLLRRWVLNNLSNGLVSDANIKANLQIDLSQPQNCFNLSALNGKIDFSDMTVDYFDGFPKVKKVNGQATFDQKNFHIKTETGTLETLDVVAGDMTITNLDQENQNMTIDLDIAGSLQNVLKLIDAKPLGLAKKFGIDVKRVSGQSVTHVRFDFPVETTLTMDKVDVKATSKLKNIDIPDALRSNGKGPQFHLTKGNIDLAVSKEQLKASGKAELNGAPAEIIWVEKFTPTKTWNSQYQIKSLLEGRKLEEIMPGILSGKTNFQLTLNKYQNNKSSLEVKANLREAALRLPESITLKAVGEPCVADLQINMKNDSISGIPRLNLTGDNVNVKASVVMDGTNTQIQSITCDSIRIHATDIKVKGQRGSNGVLRIELKGPQLDLEPFLKHNSEDQQSWECPFPVEINVNLDKIRFSDQKLLSQVQGTLKNDCKEWKNIRLTGTLPGQTNGKNNFLQILRQPKDQKDKLNISSNNAGAVMHLLSISDSTRQGQLQIMGEKQSDDSWQGNIRIEQFFLAEAPVMTHLLSLASPFGIFDALSGQTLAFDVFQSNFVWKRGKIFLKAGRASGTSLGFTVEGLIDRNKDTLKLQGAVLPYNAVNMFLLKIPIVGHLLGGEQGGIWGISYSLQGSTESPEINVNPFSALTPGFLRFIFEPSIEEEEDFPDSQAVAPVRSPHKKRTG